MFDDSLAFIMRNLHKVQAGRGVNSPGLPEIPEAVFEELIVNALIHRDYLVNASIRLFIFDNRIEIISPGHLPNNLAVERIRAGISNIRNPILVSFVAKGLLPYHGLGSGIKRALEGWPDIDFADDREGCLFTATVHRKEIAGSLESSPKSSGKMPGKALGKTPGKTPGKLLELLKDNPALSIPELAEKLGKSESAIERAIRKLRQNGLLKRIGPDKGGYWEIIEIMEK